MSEVINLGINKYRIDYSESSVERTIVLKYTVKGIEYTKTYSLVGTTLTEK